MSARIAKLEGLLSRIQNRAAAPRTRAAEPHAAAAQPEVGATEDVELDEPTLESQPFGQSSTFSARPVATPEFDAPDLIGSEFDTPELDAPDLDAPDLDAPDLDQPPSLSPDSLIPEEMGASEETSEDASIEMGAPESMDMDDLGEIDEIDEIDIDESQPESGPVSATIDDAIEAAAHHPPLTPPPESGEGLTTPRIAPPGGPTMEQLGQTISLEEGRAHDFELDEPIAQDAPASSRSHFEMEIPASAPSHSSEMAAPPEAREELERHRLGDATPIEARVSKRPVLSTNVVDLVSASKSFAPKSFLELLDASLKLK